MENFGHYVFEFERASARGDIDGMVVNALEATKNGWCMSERDIDQLLDYRYDERWNYDLVWTEEIGQKVSQAMYASCLNSDQLENAMNILSYSSKIGEEWAKNEENLINLAAERGNPEAIQCMYYFEKENCNLGQMMKWENRLEETEKEVEFEL